MNQWGQQRYDAATCKLTWVWSTEVQRTDWSMEDSPLQTRHNWSCHGSTETTRKKKETDKVILLFRKNILFSTFCLFNHFNDFEEKTMMCYIRKKIQGKIIALIRLQFFGRVLQVMFSLISWTDWATWISDCLLPWLIFRPRALYVCT